MKKLLIFSFLLFFASSMVYGQKKNKELFKAKHVAFITQQLDLTAEESEKFWPIYNEHNKELRTLRHTAKLRNYKNDLNGSDATEVLAKINDYRIKEVELKTKLSKQLEGIIPASKMVKLYFAEIEFKEEILKDLRSRYKDRQNKNSNDQP